MNENDESTNYLTGQQFAADVIEVFEGFGEDLSQEREIALFLYLPNERAATICSTTITEAGLECEVDEGDDEDDQWTCYSSVTLIPNVTELSRVGQLMIDLAAEHSGDFDGWEDQSGLSVDLSAIFAEVDYAEIGQQVLDSIQSGYAREQEYVEVDPTDFEDLDLGFYDTAQRAFEALGFTFVANMENRNVSKDGLVTFIRSMSNPQTHAVAAIYYVPGVEPSKVIELETMTSDGRFINTTSSPPGITISNSPNVDTQNVLASITEADIVAAHSTQVAKNISKFPASTTVLVDSASALIRMQNQLNACKHDHLAKIGWVTEEWLLAHGDGDAEVAANVYQAIQEILD